MRRFHRLKNTLIRSLAVIATSVSVIGVGYVFAAPTALPPGGTVPLPLNVSSTAQIKAGALTVQGGLTVTGGTGLCLGGVCKTTWPSSSVAAYNAAANGQQNIACSGYSYSNYTYYMYNQYGGYYNSYTNSNYNCTASFSVTSNAVPGVALSVVGSSVVCLISDYNYNYTWPATNQGGYYGYGSSYTLPTNVSTSINGANQAVTTGNCVLSGYGNMYGVVIANQTVRYIQ